MICVRLSSDVINLNTRPARLTAKRARLVEDLNIAWSLNRQPLQCSWWDWWWTCAGGKPRIDANEIPSLDTMIPALWSGWWASLKALKMVQLPYHDMSNHTATPSIFFSSSPSLSLVCLPQFSGQCTAQLFSRWSVMIRELLEAVTLLKCSTAVSSWSTMLKCPQRALEHHTVSGNKLLQIQPLNLSLSASKQAVSTHLFFQLLCRQRIRAVTVFTVITPL